MHFLVMSPCSHEFLLMSVYIYSNFNIIIMVIGNHYYSSLTYEHLVLDCELSTCFVSFQIPHVKVSLSEVGLLISDIWSMVTYRILFASAKNNYTMKTIPDNLGWALILQAITLHTTRRSHHMKLVRTMYNMMMCTI